MTLQIANILVPIASARVHVSMGGSAVFAPRIIVGLGLLYIGIALYFGIKLEYEASSFDFAEVAKADWPVELGSCASASNPPMGGTEHIEYLHQCQQECKRRGHRCAAFSIIEATGVRGECLLFGKCLQVRKQEGWLTFQRPANAVLFEHQHRGLSLRHHGDRTVPHRAHIIHKAANDDVQHGVEAALDADCSYCPPQKPCEEPRLCRNGKCFEGLDLPAGTPCRHGELSGFCRQGKCKTSAFEASSQFESPPPRAKASN